MIGSSENETSRGVLLLGSCKPTGKEKLSLGELGLLTFSSMSASAESVSRLSVGQEVY